MVSILKGGVVMLRDFSNTFFSWINSLLPNLPPKAKPTLCELIIASMISASGHISDAILSIKTQVNWTTYYKMIETGCFQWRHIVKNLTLMLTEIFKGRIVLAVDDTLVNRSSDKAPGVVVNFNHAPRKNDKRFVLSQLFVSLFMIIHNHDGRNRALPLCMMLSSKDGNSSKLRIALFLVRTVWLWLLSKHKDILLLCDSWYMKSSLLLPCLDKLINVIGQVRKDTALFLPPSPHSGKGRPRKYGAKISKGDFQNKAPLQSAKIFAYGKKRLFEFYEFDALVKFLKGRICKAIWCRFQNDDNKFTNWHLIICTDTRLTPEEIISLYSARWSVEPAFNSLKNSVGISNAWQQSQIAFDRWRHILCCAYCLSVMSEMFFGENLRTLLDIPWRRKQPMTAAWAARALRAFFGSFSIRSCWDRKRQKLTPPL
jgi:hypothetical protein